MSGKYDENVSRMDEWPGQERVSTLHYIHQFQNCYSFSLKLLTNEIFSAVGFAFR